MLLKFNFKEFNNPKDVNRNVEKMYKFKKIKVNKERKKMEFFCQ